MSYILFWKSQVYFKKGTVTILLYSESTMVRSKKYETPTWTRWHKVMINQQILYQTDTNDKTLFNWVTSKFSKNYTFALMGNWGHSLDTLGVWSVNLDPWNVECVVYIKSSVHSQVAEKGKQSTNPYTCDHHHWKNDMGSRWHMQMIQPVPLWLNINYL